MAPPVQAVLQIAEVEKRYQGLRPLRVQALTVAAGERVAVTGLDAAAAEVLVNLVTGASIPDRGLVRVLGRSNADISGGDEWLASLDRFGIVSPRAVLLDGATVEQNLAMPFTLDIDPVQPDIAKLVASLARECGLVEEQTGTDQNRHGLTRLAGELTPDLRARVHLGRAIALDPSLLILEHPTAEVPEAARAAFAAAVVRVTEVRRMAALVLTQDSAFALRVAHRTLTLNPATGALTPLKRGWFR